MARIWLIYLDIHRYKWLRKYKKFFTRRPQGERQRDIFYRVRRVNKETSKSFFLIFTFLHFFISSLHLLSRRTTKYLSPFRRLGLWSRSQTLLRNTTSVVYWKSFFATFQRLILFSFFSFLFFCILFSTDYIKISNTDTDFLSNPHLTLISRETENGRLCSHCTNP